MPFVEINVDEEIKKRCDASPEFKESWESHQAEFDLIGELISLRKQNKITQKELAALSGNKQQVISRIERREMMPSIRVFSNILNSLGYELRIVKKGNKV